MYMQQMYDEHAGAVLNQFTYICLKLNCWEPPTIFLEQEK